MTFEDLGLSAPLLKALDKKGYTTPTPIQEKAIPHILARKDVLASAQTGTGKTAGFTLPTLDVLTRTAKDTGGRRRIRCLVLTPTRELAAQIGEEAKMYGEFTDMRSTVIFGGVGQGPQVSKIKAGVDILIATPGRLLDLEDQGLLTLRDIEILILDEADRMLDMGFARDINKIFKLLPERRQNLLFSATFSKEIKRLANDLLDSPIRVEATPENTTAELVKQQVYRVDKANKAELITKLISDGDWSQVLVFTRTKHGADRLTRRLAKSKISAAAIHGNKSQGARTKALAGFKNGDIRILVATDIAARGLDIPQLPYAINYELPNVPEDYVHRIGRTGRAGHEGNAISLVSLDEAAYLRDIEKLLGKKLETITMPGFEPTETMEFVKQEEAAAKERKAEHQRNRSRNRQGAGGRGRQGGGGNRSSSSSSSASRSGSGGQKRRR